MRMRTMKSTLVLVGVILVVSGCGYMQRQKAKQTEPMLSAAGFKMKLADTPEKLAKIQAMPQLKLKPLKRGGKLYFAYADAEGCKCMYLGDQAAYQRYQNLLLDQRVAQESEETAAMDQDAAIIDEDAVWESWGFDVW